MFRRLKEFRRTGTRYEKLDVMFSAFIYLALSVFLAIWLVPRCVNTP
jgi:transposase